MSRCFGGCAAGEDGIEEVLDLVVAAERAGMPTHPPTTERMARMTSGKSMIQGDSWTPWVCVVFGSATMTAWLSEWRGRRLRDREVGVLVEARLAEEGLEPEAEHVEGGHAGGDEADEPEELAERVGER